MFFLALATDYDGTIAHHGVVSDETCAALERLRQTGRRIILVTGRELPDLKRVFARMELFDRIVAENGALLYTPATQEERALAAPPPPAFVELLAARNVAPLSVGRSIVATWEPHETTVLEAIRELGLEMQIIFNKGAVMVLQSGINKAAGLAAALQELDLSPINVVGVGDAENDHAFLRVCGCAAAVANALPAVRDDADIALTSDHGSGVIELIERICAEDAAMLPPERHGLLVGKDRNDKPVYVEPHRGAVLIAGTSGIGKSTLATALTERMAEKQMEFCVFDPEGDYDDLENAVSVGDAKAPPRRAQAMELLEKRAGNVVVNTQALSALERPPFFAELLPHIASLRAKSGRPHWLVIDETHHLLPADGEVAQVLPEDLSGSVFITVHPDAVATEALASVEFVIALGDHAQDVIATFCRAIGAAPPNSIASGHEKDEVLFWARSSGRGPAPVKPLQPQQKRKRHARKYAEGELGEELSFYFRGPEGSLNLRAQNLALFAQIANGLDERTWEHHRRRHDYSTWFEQVIKDDDLAREAAQAEADPALDANESRRRIVEAIERRYTAPARAERSGSLSD